MDLGFETIAKSAFVFLENKYGFLCVETGPWKVAYRSPNVFVTARFDGNRSYEIGLELGRIDNYAGSLDVPYNLGELLRTEGQSNEVTSYQVTTTEALRKYTFRLASLLREHGHSFLIGDDLAFCRVAELRNTESLNYAMENELRQTRVSLEDAWRKKEYLRIVELLSPLQEWLEPSELKKLQYAQKHLEM